MTSLPNKKFGTLFVAVTKDGAVSPGRYLRRATATERAKAEAVNPSTVRVKVYGRNVNALWLSETDTTRWLTELAQQSHAETYPQQKGE